MNTLVTLLVLVAVLAIVCVAGWYILQQFPSMPDPVRKIIMILFVAVVAIIAIIILLDVSGLRVGGFHLSGRIAGASIAAYPAAAAANMC